MTRASSRTSGTLSAGGEAEPTLRDVGVALAAGRWQILGALVLALACGAAYLAVAPPAYRSRALVQIEDPANTIARLENLSPLFDQKNPAAQKMPIEGEIAIMRSRAILGEVVDKLGLEVFAQPRRVPLLGDAIARWQRGPYAAPLPFDPSRHEWLSRFAWGAERIAVSRLAVSDDLLDRRLTLTALGAGQYALADEDGRRLLTGRVGVPATAALGPTRVDLLVSELQGRTGTDFTVRRLRRDDVIDRLQEDLKAEERPKNSGAVELELEGRDPARIASVLANLTSDYVRQNLERRSEEAAKTLEYLESQLPRAKSSVEAAERALQAFRTKEMMVDLPLEAKASVERLAELDKQLADLEAERAQLTQRYGDSHPTLVALARRIAAVRVERDALTAPTQAHPRKELESARLVRDVNVATELYLLLLKQAQALRVVQSGLIGNARLVDQPVVAHRPVWPKPAPVLALAALLGLGGGIALTLVRRTFASGATDPQGIEAATGLSVYATIPHSSRQAHLGRRSRRGLLAVTAPQDAATEHLRTLRTALAFSLRGRGNVIAVTSPSAGAGKSFVCANLAALFAAIGKRVLIVDADLRCGTVHRSFALEGKPGLSELLAREVTLEQAVHATGMERVHVLPCGQAADRPAELLSSPRLGEILAALSEQHDVVLVDTPPALTVTDSVLVARCASVTLLVLRARQHTFREISLALERFEQSGVSVRGAILNDASPADVGYAYPYERRAAPRASSARA